VDVAPEWRLLAPDRLIGAQLRRTDQLAIDLDHLAASNRR
jgi:hypothetical protein